MGGKKGGKAKKDKDKEEPEEKDKTELENIDRAFYDLQISTLNKKIQRLRQDNSRYIQEFEEMRTAYDQLDTDRADVIAFLKLSLQNCTDENQELQDRLIAMQQERAEEVQKYEDRIAEMQEEFKSNYDQLKSEITLLAGKLNALEEFRIQKETLEKNLQNMKEKLIEWEEKYKNDLDAAERKVMYVRHQFKQEVDRHLDDLKLKFEETCDIRIHVATKRLIRENIAINTELSQLVQDVYKYHEANAQLRQTATTSRIQRDLSEQAARIALEKCEVQSDIVKKLSTNYETLCEHLNDYDACRNQLQRQTEEINNIKLENEKLCQENKSLKEQIQKLSNNNESLGTLLKNVELEAENFKELIDDCSSVIKRVLNFEIKHLKDKKDVTETILVDQSILRDELLNSLLKILDNAETKPPRCKYLDESIPLKSLYKKGDVGFIPSSGRSGRLSGKPKSSQRKDSKTFRAQLSFDEYPIRTPDVSHASCREPLSKIKGYPKTPQIFTFSGRKIEENLDAVLKKGKSMVETKDTTHSELETAVETHYTTLKIDDDKDTKKIISITTEKRKVIDLPTTGIPAEQVADEEEFGFAEMDSSAIIAEAEQIIEELEANIGQAIEDVDDIEDVEGTFSSNISQASGNISEQ